MRKIREILRLHYERKLSYHNIAKSICVSTSTISECLKRASKVGLSWPLSAEISEESLEKMLYQQSKRCSNKMSELIDFAYINQELKKKGLTLYLLWEEYQSNQPNGLSYSRFCHKYRQWVKSADVTMRQSHKLGEKLFVDYSGMTVPIVINKLTGETRKAEIFIAVLGASNYTYAEATWTQSLPDWIGSHVRAFEFFGGVPEILVPDNLKSGITKANLYEPDINPTFQDMAQHYGVAVIPARVRAPKDKAKAEKAVNHIENRILAKLRNRTFFSLEELNEAIKLLIEEINRQPFQKLPGSRLSQF